MTTSALRMEVEALMRAAAEAVILPRFRQLEAGDVREKSPGEVVTCVDLEVERLLTEGLHTLVPGARIVGEEAVAADPALLGRAGSGAAWLIDPLDGTANYAAGREHFGVMIALVLDGIPQMGWILDPLQDRMCFAERGSGAWCNGQTVRCAATSTERPAAALGTHFLSPAQRNLVHAVADAHFDRRAVPMCAAESYWRLVLGDDAIMLFQRSLPWDHAAGALFVQEAGGHISHWNRADYCVGGPGTGILAARDHRLWQWAAEILLHAASGLVPELGRAA